jgi:hypothetical protein
MARLSPQGKFRALDQNGDPLSGGKLYTYEAGTSTPKTSYTAADEVTPNSNPVILDANGYANVYLESGSYKLVLDDVNDVNQWTADDVAGSGGGGYASSVVTESTNFNLTTSFQNSLIVCTAALSISLLPSSTANEGFIFTVKNTSSGDVTIDPNGAELIDGNATHIVKAGFTANIVSDGTGWVTFGSAYKMESIPTATIAADDKVVVLDTDDSDNVKTVTTQNIADLAGLGKVLQIQQGETTTPVVADSASWLEVQTFNFTPVSDSSTIVIFYNGVCGDAATSSSSWDLRIQRDAVTVIQHDDYVFIGNHIASEAMRMTSIGIDTPATTSTIAYNIDVQRSAGSGSCDWNNGYTSGAPSKSTITVVEILL